MGELQAELQRVSGTTLDAQGAANAWAGTTGLGLVGALNVKAGSSGLELEGVLRRLIGSARGSTDPALLTTISPNLLTANQAGIETDASGWIPGVGAPTKTRSTAQALDGSASLSLVATAVGPATITGLVNPRPAVAAGKTHVARAWVRSGIVARNARIRIAYYNAAGTWLMSGASAATPTTTTGWTELTHSLAATDPTTVSALIEIQFENTLVGEEFFLDRISLVET